MSALRVLLLLIVSLALSGNAFADDRPILHFAGFAFAGNASEKQNNYPFSTLLAGKVESSGQTAINRDLVNRLNAETFENFTLSTDQGNYKTGDGLAVAFVLTWENVGTERFSDFVKVSIDLQAQALVFDFASKQIVAAYPFGMQFIDSAKSELSQDAILEDVRKMYRASGLFDQFAKVLHRISTKSSFGSHVQVIDADVGADAQQYLKANGVDAGLARSLLLTAFERYLSRNADIPVLPHSNDQAIGGAMAARFVNGDVYDFKIPAPDYTIRLALTNMRRVEVDRTDAETGYAYASYLKVTVDDAHSSNHILDASFKYPVVKIIANSGTPDDRSGIQESLLAISDQVTQQFANSTGEWLGKWLVDDSQRDNVRKMQSVLERCR